MFIVNEAFWGGLPKADREMLQAVFDGGAAWQDKELLSQEASLIATMKSQGMTVIEPNLAEWRKPVLDTVPKKFEEKWSAGTFDALLAL